jgi:hypothetical protein
MPEGDNGPRVLDANAGEIANQDRDSESPKPDEAPRPEEEITPKEGDNGPR